MQLSSPLPPPLRLFFSAMSDSKAVDVRQLCKVRNIEEKEKKKKRVKGLY